MANGAPPETLLVFSDRSCCHHTVSLDLAICPWHEVTFCRKPWSLASSLSESTDFLFIFLLKYACRRSNSLVPGNNMSGTFFG
jgi:hypothetical protein